MIWWKMSYSDGQPRCNLCLACLWLYDPRPFLCFIKRCTLPLIHHCQRWHTLDSLIIPSSPRIWRAIADRVKDNISSPVDTASAFDRSESVNSEINFKRDWCVTKLRTSLPSYQTHICRLLVNLKLVYNYWTWESSISLLRKTVLKNPEKKFSPKGCRQ